MHWHNALILATVARFLRTDDPAEEGKWEWEWGGTEGMTRPLRVLYRGEKGTDNRGTGTLGNGQVPPGGQLTFQTSRWCFQRVQSSSSPHTVPP